MFSISFRCVSIFRRVKGTKSNRTTIATTMATNPLKMKSICDSLETKKDLMEEKTQTYLKAALAMTGNVLPKSLSIGEFSTKWIDSKLRNMAIM